MVHYLPDGSDWGRFQYAFAMPDTNGRTGPQYVPFNTFQPSLDPADVNNALANWIQITNLSEEEESGRLFYYAMNGDPLGSSGGEQLTLRAGERVDRPAHQFGSSLVGIVEWRPDDETALFLVRNVRYLYDNPDMQNSFDTAFQLPGLQGSGELLAIPLDTNNASSIIEVLNTSNAAVTAEVNIYSGNGRWVTTLALTEEQLPAHGSFHIIADEILGLGQLGVATIQGSAPNSVAAIVMQYRRGPTLGIEYMYGLAARQALGALISGSYNTFVQQSSRIVLVNTSNAEQTVSLSMVRSSGETVVSGSSTTIPATGAVKLDLNALEVSDNYGVVSVQAQPNSIVGWVLRERGTEYCIPTPVRQ